MFAHHLAVIVITICGIALGCSSSSKSNCQEPPQAGEHRDECPPKPIGVQATRNRCDSVVISWAPMDGAYTFDVLRKEASDTGEPSVVKTGSTTTNWLDQEVPCGSDYSYFVRAVGEDGIAGERSETALGRAWCTLAAPSWLNATDGSERWNIIVTWAAVAGAQTYVIERRSCNTQQSWKIVPADTNSLASRRYIDRRRTCGEGVKMEYRVRARNDACGEGPNSPVDCGWCRP